MIQRVGEPFAPESLMTDSLGEAHVSVILRGQVHVAAYRVLDESETGPAGGVILAFGDGRIRDISSGKTVPLNLRADKTGSIVFSEWYPGHTLHYAYGGYVELYNNSDTTVYLDSMLLGRGWPYNSETELGSCAESEPYRNDPRGLWSREMHMFPGSGRDYPLAPGQAVTVALDAVDHSVADAGLPDLTNADFELEGTADADNPDFASEPISPSHVRSLYQSVRRRVNDALELLEDRRDSLPLRDQEAARVVLEAAPRADAMLQRLRELHTDGQRIRIHGDLHLGQFLDTGSDVVLIDFEGEEHKILLARREHHGRGRQERRKNLSYRWKS